MPGAFADTDYELITTGDNTLTVPGGTFKGGIPSSEKPYNALLMDLFGSVTAAGGAAAGFGTADVINTFSLYLTPNGNAKEGAGAEFQLIENVRYFTLVLFARDWGFTATQTDAGSGGSTTAVVSFLLPVGRVRPEDSLRFEGTIGALATFHTTATAINFTLTILPFSDYSIASSVANSWIGYKEEVLDVIAADNIAGRPMRPGPIPDRWKLGRMLAIRCESARGTLSDGWDSLQATIGGKYPAGRGLAERFHKAVWNYWKRTASITGLTLLQFAPKVVKISDRFDWDNESTATVAGTSMLFVYLVSQA